MEMFLLELTLKHSGSYKRLRKRTYRSRIWCLFDEGHRPCSGTYGKFWNENSCLISPRWIHKDSVVGSKSNFIVDKHRSIAWGEGASVFYQICDFCVVASYHFNTPQWIRKATLEKTRPRPRMFYTRNVYAGLLVCSIYTPFPHRLATPYRRRQI